jgi:hypothetical protein
MKKAQKSGLFLKCINFETTANPVIAVVLLVSQIEATYPRVVDKEPRIVDKNSRIDDKEPLIGMANH